MKKLRKCLGLFSKHLSISIPINAYLLLEAKRRHITVPKEYIKILKNKLEQNINWRGKILYAWLWSAGSHVPNASATIPGVILVNAEWAARIIFDQDNPHMHDAFALTICHEITHQENDFFSLDLFSTDGKFVSWVDEVHADFGGGQKGLEGNRSRTSSAMKYKLSCKKKKDKDTRNHPSWNRRIGYIENFNFNDELIDQISYDCGCKNDKLINAVKVFFDTIELD